jgi:antiviral helicase SKI2
MRDLLSRGIGVHHGGLLPIVKEVVEMLFQRGLVKVLFATETFAMGVNMPARSVVFSGIRKHDGHSFRELLAGEYTQMSGRAGRRGLDPTGVVIINAADELPETGLLSKMLLGQPTKLQSQFRLTYNMILNLLRVEALKVEEMIKRSFSENASQRLLPDQEKKVKEVEKLLSSLPDMPDKERAEDLNLYYDMCLTAQRSNLDVLQMAQSQQQGVKYFAPGRIVVLYDSQFSTFAPAVIVKAVSSDDYLVLAAVSEEMKSGKLDSRWEKMPPRWPPTLHCYSYDGLVYDLREVPLSSIVTITMHVIKIEQSMIMALRISAMQRTVEAMQPIIREMSNQSKIAEADWGNLRRIDFQEVVKERAKYDARVKDFLSGHSGFTSEPTFVKEYDMTHHRKLLETEIRRLKMSMSDENLELLPDYHQRIEVLKRMRFIDPVSENVLLKGRVACEINSVDELVSTELILDNFWNAFEPEEIVGLLSCLVFKEKADGEIELEGRLLQGYETIVATAERISSIQSHFQLNTLNYETALKTHMVPVAHQWAKGMPFAEICQMTDIAEGTIVRVITRLDESCRELRDAARVIGDADLWSKMEICQQLIRRDVIFAASLYF